MTNQANFYELSKGKTRVVFSDSGFTGPATLSYEDGKIAVGGSNFIDEKTAAGRLLTMTVEIVPDGYTKTISLLLPHVHLDDSNETPVKTVLVYAYHKSNFAGHDAVQGQVTEYETKTLKGIAMHVA